MQLAAQTLGHSCTWPCRKEVKPASSAQATKVKNPTVDPATSAEQARLLRLHNFTPECNFTLEKECEPRSHLRTSITPA
jgi:hypothetical protein